MLTSHDKPAYIQRHSESERESNDSHFMYGQHVHANESIMPATNFDSGLDMILAAAGVEDFSTTFTPQPSQSLIACESNRTKVAVACTNCKKAHVACNLERPCRRCVAMDKDCIDTLHKKR